MKRTISYLLSGAAAAFFVVGCASTKPLPRAYLESDHEMAVDYSRLKPKPVMRDSGQGGLIGILVNAGRGSNMREKLAGIQGETLKELLRQEITKQLEKKFIIAEDKKDLILDVNIETWGWFVPSTMLGIKTGAYQCEIMGRVRMLDVKLKNKEVACVDLHVQKPLGNDPTPASAQEALLGASHEFATKLAEFLLQRKTPDGKILKET